MRGDGLCAEGLGGGLGRRTGAKDSASEHAFVVAAGIVVVSPRMERNSALVVRTWGNPLSISINQHHGDNDPMKFLCTVTAAAALLGGVLAISAPANARMADPSLHVPQAAENVACRVVRDIVRGPRGTVWRSRTVCTPTYVRPQPRCFTDRQRIVRPNGTVVFRTVQRCR